MYAILNCNPICIDLATNLAWWVPNEHIYQLPDASFLCEYFQKCRKLLEDGYFNEASSEALSWKHFSNKVKLT